jgi:hypothetical protein
MIYFFHHYELPVIVQQAQIQQIFIRSVRNNNNNQAAAAAAAPSAANQQNRENQQQQAGSDAPAAPAPEQPVNNANNMFLIRGTYRRRVNHLVERLRNNFYSNVLGVGMLADNNNNNNPGLNNLTRSLRLLNLLFPNRPILNVRIINVRSASASATVADILRTAEGVEGEGGNGQNNEGVEGGERSGQSNEGVDNDRAASDDSGAGPSQEAAPDSRAELEMPSAVRLPHQETSSSPPDTQPSASDPSFASNDGNAVPESTAKHQASTDVKNSENVMQSTASDGGTSTSSSNEQC